MIGVEKRLIQVASYRKSVTVTEFLIMRPLLLLLLLLLLLCTPLAIMLLFVLFSLWCLPISTDDGLEVIPAGVGYCFATAPSKTRPKPGRVLLGAVAPPIHCTKF